MINPSEFIKEHPWLCAFTLGVAVIGYMLYRTVEWILHRDPQIQQIHTVAQQALTPPPVTAPKNKEIPVLEKIYPYEADLTPLQKAELQTKFLDDDTLEISYPQAPNFHVTIRRQDLFASGAQVIVNAANTHLGGGRGIDGAIHAKGGSAYAKAHKDLQTKYNSNYTEGYAAMIDSGSLKKDYSIDHVIVVAGPQGKDITKEKEQALYSCYYNSLLLAETNHIKRLAFPSISTGIFSFPKEKAASIAVKAIYDFITNNPKANLTTISIHFLANAPKSDLEIYQQATSK